jgi:formiminotetrahydrofolate cyclodeaminase
LAVTVALAAGLASMSARFSTEHIEGAEALARELDGLRSKVALLSEVDSDAYSQVLKASKAQGSDPGAAERLARALSDAAEIPLAVAEAGATVTEVAARLVERGNPNLRGDALAGTLLAEAAVRSAVRLVTINLNAAGVEDKRLHRCEELMAVAAASRSRVDS